jgi:hypothetical protein
MFELQPLNNHRGWRYIGDVMVCPCCERRSVYSRGENRFFHLDGSANIACWVHISSGRLVPRPVLAGGSGGGDGQQAAA